MYNKLQGLQINGKKTNPAFTCLQILQAVGPGLEQLDLSGGIISPLTG